MKLKQNQTTQKCTDSVIQSKLKHTSVRIPACTSATGELPCQLSRVNTFNICLLLRSRAICLTHRAGRWKRVPIPKGTRGWYSGISTSEQQALHAPVPCSALLFQSPFSHTWSLFAYAKASKQDNTPPSTPLSVSPVMQKPKTMENHRSAKNPTSLYNKKEQCSSYFS